MRALLIKLIPIVLCGANAFTLSGISAARLRMGLPTIGQRRHEPPSISGRCTCCIGDMTQRARSHARSKTRTHLEVKRRDADQITKVGNDKDGRSAAATAAGSSSGRKVTQMDDGSPLGVAIVVLGGAWVVLGDRGDGGGGGSGGDAAQIMLPPFLAPMIFGGGDGGGTGSTDGRIWAVFITASVAAGISRLVRYYWNKK